MMSFRAGVLTQHPFAVCFALKKFHEKSLQLHFYVLL